MSISSPVGSQIPHAVGAAWAAKLQKKDDVAVGFFGEGATSTPTFHVSANFAAVFKIPVILMCRNNGWAISVPRSVQTASPTFAQKAIAYGMPGVLVDGNDILAMIHVVARGGGARPAGRGRDADRGASPTGVARTARRTIRPCTAIRPSPRSGRAAIPLDRLRAYMQARGELPAGYEEKVQAEVLAGDPTTRSPTPNRVAPKPPIASLFEDVYADVPWHLREQQALLEAELRQHGDKKPPHGE